MTKNGNRSRFKIYRKLLICTASFKLEKAVGISRRHNISLDRSNLDRLLSMGETGATTSRPKAESSQRKLKNQALKNIRSHGFIPEKIIERVLLPEGYNGKILMASLIGGVFNRFTILRSGDLWHREILHNTRLELKTLGFENTEVYPLGGAYAGFDSDQRIVISGASEDYGACDKRDAAELIREVYGDREILVSD